MALAIQRQPGTGEATATAAASPSYTAASPVRTAQDAWLPILRQPGADSLYTGTIAIPRSQVDAAGGAIILTPQQEAGAHVAALTAAGQRAELQGLDPTVVPGLAAAFETAIYGRTLGADRTITAAQAAELEARYAGGVPYSGVVGSGAEILPSDSFLSRIMGGGGGGQAGAKAGQAGGPMLAGLFSDPKSLLIVAAIAAGIFVALNSQKGGRRRG